ncbi:MAG: hypothetical protein ABWY18_05785 [Tardiphaga sp.]
MNEESLQQIAADLNVTPGAAERAPRMAKLVSDTNATVAAAALRSLAFDSSPYQYQAWLAGEDER